MFEMRVVHEHTVDDRTLRALGLIRDHSDGAVVQTLHLAIDRIAAMQVDTNKLLESAQRQIAQTEALRVLTLEGLAQIKQLVQDRADAVTTQAAIDQVTAMLNGDDAAVDAAIAAGAPAPQPQPEPQPEIPAPTDELPTTDPVTPVPDPAPPESTEDEPA